MALRWIDSHSHLSMLEHSPLPDILERARTAGVSHLITVSTDEKNWSANQTIAASDPNIYFTVGLHPHDTERWSSLKETFLSYFPNDKIPVKCVAIGEIGLDYYYNHSARETQIEAFEDQLTFAKKWNLPVVIHCREAFADLFQSIKKVGVSARGGVMHCFTGTKEEAKQSLDLGFKISFSGILTFPKAPDLREAAKIVPLDSVLIETDCPYLAPLPFRGKPNEPSFLPHTGTVLAHCHQLPVEKIAEATFENTHRFFRLN